MRGAALAPVPGKGVGDARSPAPEPVTLGRWVRFPKDDVFEACGALALAEVLLRRLGRPAEAARMAAVFELMEAGLTR